MARAHHVKRARQDNPAVKKGSEYWWWAFMVGGRGGPKHYSAKPPRPSQLTSSEFLSAAYALGEQAADFEDDGEGTWHDEFDSLRDDLAGEWESLADEQDEKRDNMPEGLQDGPVGELLEERGEACRAVASELENLDRSDFEDSDDACNALAECEYQGE